MKPIRRLTASLVLVNAALIFGSLHWLGCASGPAAPPPDQPGYIYNMTWAGVYVSCGNGQYPASTDIDGKVGYPLSVGSLLARAVGGWTCNYTVVSGELPPGLSFDDRYAVSGIPTERGHWILHLRATDITTGNGQYNGYGDVDMILRFHITGSGEVNE